MWWNELSQRRRSVPGEAHLVRPQSRHRLRLRPEQLEDRALLTGYTAASVSGLISDINASNLAGGSNAITLVAGTTFTLTAVNNTTNGATGLPVITANDNLTIAGNGDIVQRSTATGTPDFRLLEVAAGASLTLQSLTLQGGVSADLNRGGGIDNEGGSLTLTGVTIQNNSAGLAGALCCSSTPVGGGIYSIGSLTMQSSTIQNNQAIGTTGNPDQTGGDAYGGGIYIGGPASLSNVTVDSNTAQSGSGGIGALGGRARGGGIYINAGGPTGGMTVNLSNVTLHSDTARGGQGGQSGTIRGGGGHGTGSGGHHHFRERLGPGNGGDGVGGGIYVAGGAVTLLNTSMSSNTAMGGLGGGEGASNGQGEAGGLYIESVASVSLDAFTQAHIINNTASTADPNIDGSYTIV
jgi:hypothetical protein